MSFEKQLDELFGSDVDGLQRTLHPDTEYGRYPDKDDEDEEED